MNQRLIAVGIGALVLLLGGISGLRAADKDKGPPKLSAERQKELAEAMRGTFDFTKEPRPFCALLILDQEGNKFPSFWCGSNEKGTTSFASKYDILEQTIDLAHSGSLTVDLGHTAFKYGMDDILPAGAWMKDLRERHIYITIDQIDDTRITDVRKGSLFVDIALGGAGGKDSKVIEHVGTFSGSASYGDLSAPIAGDITLTFMDTITIFALHATFPFPGNELGLPGDKGKGITAQVWTASTPMVSKPDLEAGAADALVPMGDAMDIEDMGIDDMDMDELMEP